MVLYIFTSVDPSTSVGAESLYGAVILLGRSGQCK